MRRPSVARSLRIGPLLVVLGAAALAGSLNAPVAGAQNRLQSPSRATRPPARATRPPRRATTEASLLLPAIQVAGESVTRALPRAAPAPEPLGTADKRRALAAISGTPALPGGHVAAPDASLQSVVLSARRMLVSEKAYLSAVQPSKIDPMTGEIELTIANPGWLNVHLNVLAGVSYLVDLTTTTWGDGHWRITVGEEVLEIDQGNWSDHVLFGVQAPESGWIRADIRRVGSGARIHEIAVDRAD